MSFNDVVLPRTTPLLLMSMSLAPNVAVLSAVAGNPAAVWVHDVPVISAVGLLLSTLILLIFFHLVVNAFSSTELYVA